MADRRGKGGHDDQRQSIQQPWPALARKVVGRPETLDSGQIAWCRSSTDSLGPHAQRSYLTISEGIAAYAAAAATAALGWNIWQSRRARQHHVELKLIHTLLVRDSGEFFRTVFLEAYNRGDHPIRVAAAGISTQSVGYAFEKTGIAVTLRGGIRIEVTPPPAPRPDPEQGDDPPLPGVILARDGNSSSINDEFPDVVLKALKAAGRPLPEGLEGELSRQLDNEIQGWIQLSTGEWFETKQVRFDWDQLAQRGAQTAY